jgi:hypothetical protein
MIDVDCPSIEISLQFFQRWFNRTLPNSPNDTAYMFWPLYRKTYSDEDRLCIIIDHHHHLGTYSVVAIKGLHPLETLVKFVNGVYTTIQRLLLSIPAPGTVTGKLFVQVERQLSNDWLVCCFQTQDAPKVTLRLSTLEDSMKKVIHPDFYQNVFISEVGLSFNGQVAPVIKGRNKLPRLDIPEETETYVNQSMQRLYTPTIKRQAVEIEDPQDCLMDQPSTISVPRQVPASFHNVVIPTPTSTITQPAAQVTHQEPAQHPVIQELQNTSNQHSATLLDLRQCCVTLVQSQQTLQQQLVDMNLGINQKFELMAASIENLKLPPTRHCQKIHKDFHRTLPEENLM